MSQGNFNILSLAQTLLQNYRNGQLYISAWMAHRNSKLSMTQTALLAFSPSRSAPHLPYPRGQQLPSFQLMRTNTGGPPFPFSLPPAPHIQSVKRACCFDPQRYPDCKHFSPASLHPYPGARHHHFLLSVASQLVSILCPPTPPLLFPRYGLFSLQKPKGFF